MHEQEVELAAGAIRNYLTQRPDATDTLEGIHHFWVNQRLASPEVTRAALKRLEALGFVARVVVGGRTLWRRAPQA